MKVPVVVSLRGPQAPFLLTHTDGESVRFRGVSSVHPSLCVGVAGPDGCLNDSDRIFQVSSLRPPDTPRVSWTGVHSTVNRSPEGPRFAGTHHGRSPSRLSPVYHHRTCPGPSLVWVYLCHEGYLPTVKRVNQAPGRGVVREGVPGVGGTSPLVVTVG